MINKKIPAIITCLLLSITLISSVFALSSGTFTLRSSGVNNLESLDIYNSFQNSKVKFSVFHSDSRNSGKGSLSITAKAPNNDRLSLNVRLTETNITELTGDKIIVKYKAEGRYYISGITPFKVEIDDVTVEYDYSTGKTIVFSEEGINFYIENLETRALLSPRHFRND